VSTAIGRWALLVAMLAVASPASAHVLDEYLQATIIDIEPGDIRLRINLTPGVDIAWQVIELIDRNDNGTISPEEATTYANTLNRDLSCQLDQRTVKLRLIACEVPAPADLHTGMGIIKAEFSLEQGDLSSGMHSLTLENHHFPGIGVYLFNAAQPESALIRIVGQKRNVNQSTGEVEFSFDPPGMLSGAHGWVVALPVLLAAILTTVWRRRKSGRFVRGVVS
jgi:hypothetical protein